MLRNGYKFNKLPQLPKFLTLTLSISLSLFIPLFTLFLPLSSIFPLYPPSPLSLLLSLSSPPSAYAGEFLVQPGENILVASIENSPSSTDSILVSITVTLDPAVTWFTIFPYTKTVTIAPKSTEKVSFTLSANCDTSTMGGVTGKAAFEYTSTTEGVLDGTRKRVHTFIMDKSVGFVANKEAGKEKVTVINLDQCTNIGKSLGQLVAGARPYGVAVRSDGRMVYVTNENDKSLSVIDLGFDPSDPDANFSNAKEIKIPLGEGFTPSFITVTPDNSRAYIADQAGVLKVVNLMYWTYFSNSDRDTLDPMTGKVFPPYEFVNDPASTIQIVGAEDFNKNPVKGSSIEAMSIDPSGRRLWVVVKNGFNTQSDGGSVAVVDIEQVVLRDPSWPAFHSIVKVIDLQRQAGGDAPLNEPSGISFTPDGDLAYVTGEGTIRLITEILNWEDGTGGITVLDPQAVYDPSLDRKGANTFVDYVAPHVLGSKPEIQFFTFPRVDYTPFMMLGGGMTAGIFMMMQQSFNALASTYDYTIYKYPVDIDGTESIAISPNGKRAYITFFNTNNFGIIDLEPSTQASGFQASNPPSNNDIYAASEAILPELYPGAQNPYGWDFFPNEITFSRDGRFALITNRGYNNDMVTMIDSHQVDNILYLLDNGQLPTNEPGQSGNLSREDLKTYPIDKLPTDYPLHIYPPYDDALIRYIGSVAGIADPEGVITVPGYDNDGDMNSGGASNLVEAKNRFNSLLKLPGSLLLDSLISSHDNNLFSPVISNGNDQTIIRNKPYGDNLNNYDEGNDKDTMPGELLNGVLLPTEGLGYRHEFGSDPYNSDNAGSLSLINVLEDIGRQWFARHPQGPRVVFLDLSRPGGGQFRDISGQGRQLHAAHQNGLDASIRYISKDDNGYPSENPFEFILSNGAGSERDNRVKGDIAYYDPNLSTELINMFLANEKVDTVTVDPQVIASAEKVGLSLIASEKLIVRGDLSDPNSRRDYDDHFGVRVRYGESKNHPPVADAGYDQVITEETSFTLYGSGSFDSDGDTLTYKWIQKEGTSAGLTAAKEKEKNPVLICPDNTDSAQEHKSMIFGLTVFDGEFESQEDTVKIIINRKPVANAGEDQTISTAGMDVTIDGSESYDPDGDELIYFWRQTEGVAVGSDFFYETYTFPAPSVNTKLKFELMVNDCYVDSNNAAVLITVNPE